MMRDYVQAKQRLEIAKDAWLTIKTIIMFFTATMFAVLTIFVFLKSIGVI